MNCQKHLFDLDDNHHYLNCAFLSPLLKSVEEAGISGVQSKKRPWKVTSNHFFEDSEKVRSLFAKLVHADSPESVAILPAVSYGMGMWRRICPLKKVGILWLPVTSFRVTSIPGCGFVKRMTVN